jgi:tight adherence protein B
MMTQGLGLLSAVLFGVTIFLASLAIIIRTKSANRQKSVNVTQLRAKAAKRLAAWLCHGLCALFCFSLAAELGLNATVQISLGIAGLFISREIGRALARRQRRAFASAFTIFVEAACRGAAAGFPLGRCLAVAAQAAPPRIKPMVAVFTGGSGYATPLEDALQNFAASAPGGDANLFCAAVRLSHETGASLSQCLAPVLSSLEERRQLQRKAEAAAAQARGSAMIVAIMTVAVLTSLAMLVPGSFQMLVETPQGQAVLAYALLSCLAGAAVMHWLTGMAIQRM